jgi:GMP synthase-like glutamine amidotransferase
MNVAASSSWAEAMVAVGLLECGRNRSEWLKPYGDFADWFGPFLQPADPSLDFTVYKAHQGELPARVHACGAWLLTGSPHSVYEDHPWQRALTTFLVEAVKARPVIGICYGHQHLHAALGGVVEKRGQWGVGVQTYAIHDMPEWLPDRVAKASANGLRLIALHQDHVSVLAPGSRVLAGSASCPAGVTTIGDNVLTFQAHPEMAPELAREIYDFHREDIGAGLATEAKQTLDRKIDARLAAQWIVAFLNRRSNANNGQHTQV